MILRCTAKARAMLSARDLVNSEPDNDDWYVNLLWFARRKCLLFTHAGTVFPVFVADVRKADVTPLESSVANVVRRELSAEGLPLTALGELTAPAGRRQDGEPTDARLHERDGPVRRVRDRGRGRTCALRY